MFPSHLNDGRVVPILRQPSTDSLGTRPTTSATESSCSSLTSQVGMHSPQQPYTHASRRTSVFALRSRSNTTTSTTPSMLSSSHSDLTEHDEAWQDTSASSDASRVRARRSFFRGRMGKRLSESIDSSMGMMDFSEREPNDKRASMLRKGKKHSHQSSSDLKNLISSPFDFQHLTHTDRHQLTAFERAADQKQGAELWAIQATQHAPKGVSNVVEDNLHFNNFSNEHLETSEYRSSSSLSFRSPPQSPKTQRERRQPDGPPQVRPRRPALRLARSVDSFSQPSVSPRGQPHSQSVTSLPRLSSRIGQTEELSSRGATRSKRESGVWDHFAGPSLRTPDQLPGIPEPSSYFGHALTTPDDTAIHAMTPPFSPRLADVAEEPERFVSPRPAPHPPAKSPSTPKSPVFEDAIITTRVSPLTRPRARGQSHSSPPSRRNSSTRPISQSSDTLGSYRIARRESVKRPSATRRKSNTWRAIEESWEDDVDFIYENALEADCDFEWDQRSEHATDFEVNESSASAGFRASLLVPHSSSVPDLVPASTVSMSAMSASLSTPHDSFDAKHFDADNGFVLTPSLLIPEEYKDNGEVSYEDLLNEYEGSDRHFPMLDTRASTISSARSSHFRFSRRSSYDSSLVSTAQYSATWSSPVRRSASSAGSVPDLLPSRRSRKDLGVSLMVDQLSDQVASLRQLGDGEGDDITPPGRAMEERTFFSSEDETPPEEQPRASLEENLRASLELARQGTRQPPVQDRQHRPTRSEGAAKMFAKASSTQDDTSVRRNRAVTTTQARQPMLSLFPAPPRNATRPAH